VEEFLNGDWSFVVWDHMSGSRGGNQQVLMKLSTNIYAIRNKRMRIFAGQVLRLRAGITSRSNLLMLRRASFRGGFHDV
jgi:hypothetical protein